jgi:hypothetical protein
MEYLIPAAIVVLVVAAFVTFVSLYSVRKGGPGEHDRNAGDSGDARPGMGADSATPLGDTDQLSDAPAGTEGTGGGRFQRDEGERDTRPESEKLADRGF